MIKSFLIFTILFLQISVGSAAEEIVNIEKQTPVLMAAEKATAVLKTEDQIPLNIDHIKSTSGTTSAPTRLLLTGIILAALLTSAYYFVKKYKLSNTINKSNRQIKVLSQHYLGPKKSLAIIRVAGESILIGVTEANISMIKSLALIDDEIPTEIPQNFFEALNNEKVMTTKKNETPSSVIAMAQDELEEEFSFSGLKDSVSKKLKSMRSI